MTSATRAPHCRVRTAIGWQTPSVPASTRSLPRLVALAPLVCGALLVGCGDDDDGGDTARFCDAVAEHRDALFAPVLASSADVDALVELYREVGEHAPLAVEEDWQAITAMFETAGEFAPGDTTVTEQDVLVRTYSSEQSALAVRDWLADHCEIAIAVATVPAPPLDTIGAAVPTTGA